MSKNHEVVDRYLETLHALKSRFPIYHLSNFFFRDVQFGIRDILESKGVKVSYTEAEKLARALIDKLERERIFLRINDQTWAVHYPEFKTPAVPGKQAGPAPAAPNRPAAQKSPVPATTQTNQPTV